MAFINTTSVAGLILALYLSTFVLFAVVRIATGVSIQRIGYLSLRRIAFTPREGIRVELRSLGLNIHRPTFAQPTWLSLRFGELHVTVDPSLIQQSQTKRTKRNPEGAVAEHLGPDRATRGAEQRAPSASRRSKLWKRLTETKERIKRLHRQIKWIRLIDLIAFNTTLDIVNVGRLQMGVFSLALDTRQKMVDRGKLWRHKKEASKGERPAEWIVVIKSILLSLPQNDSVEVLDSLTFNIHGFLSKQKEGLRDTSIAIRLGKLHVPLSEIMELRTRLASNFPSEEPKSAITFKHQEEFSFNELAEELDKPGSREDTIVQTVADSKEFVSSILRGVQEIQMALSWVRVSHRIQPSPTTPTPLLLNVVLHELGVDLHRLDPRTPAHRMYFSKDDVAHQALVAVISISVSLGENEADSSKILYVPMTTTTVKTTLPAKTVSFSEHRDVTERNANVFFSNLVITSPSVDLEPRHLPVLHAILTGRPTTSKRATSSNHRLVSRLLPKISLKLSIQEPVIRCVLPHPVQNSKSADDYDLLISSISSISLDVESSHSSTNEQEYSLSSNFRLVDHKFYYQSSAGNKHDMVYMESVEVKTQVNAANDVSVAISGTLRTFTIRMVREEVGQGVYRIVKQFNKSVQSDKLRSRLDKAPRRSFLRRIPKWLTIIQLEGSNFSVEIAGTDAQISKNTRGLALQLESWTAEYLSHRFELGRRGSSSRRRTISSSTVVDSPKSPPRHHHSRRYGNDQTDGRRLAIHVRNLEGFIIEDDTLWESDPFLSLPRSEVALSTSSDLQGSIFHVNSHIKALLVHFSLYRYYAVGVAGTILREAFFGPPAKIPYSDANKSHDSNPDFPQGLETGHPNHYSNTHSADLVTVDVKAALIQVKTQMPHDPPMLLQIYELAAGRHRWSSPFLRAHLIRLHAEAPFLKHVWARVASVNNIRLDLRRSRKPGKPNAGEEQSIDLATDFIRLAIPHGLTTYKIFDNFINVAKTISQLNHRFKTRTNDYILEKHPEEPKRVPRISVRSKALLFELEDDPFEWKLGLIYRVGKVEQVQRIAREEAFKAKAKKVDTEINRRASSGRRDVSQSRHRHSSQTSVDHARSRSYDFSTSRRSRSRGRQGLRYDPDGVCDMSSTSKVNTSDAWQKLQEHNARSWKRRIDSVMQLSDTKIRRVRRLFAGADEPPESAEDHEAVLSIPSRPGILGAIISDLHLMIDKPSFPLAECNSFLHRIGKGIPLDMQYSMLVPMHLKLDMGEARVVLRDYPLNLLHVPAIRPGQPPKLPSWSLETDFVIAEEFRDYRSTRHVKVDIIPPSHDEDGGLVPGFALDVRRTVSPVKTYSDVTVDVNTSLATTISWGTAYQPVIQDMMMIIEGFTKPEIDPSDRVGFWDKIRLNFHSRISVHWKGDGDVQLRLKGSRDPYVVTGYGAGFVMCWRNDVQWRINTDDDPRRFMTVTSGEYVLAIPDYSRHARSMQGLELENDTESASTGSSQKNAAIFKKVVMKLSGNVQWTAGLVFERDPAEGKRSFDFKPHHEVVLRNPKHLSEEELKDYDAFKGFRSDHIHLSVGVSAPFDREWTSSNTTPSKSYNTVHLTPKFFTHFYDWWSLFSGVMSLPIRQGKLWRGLEKKSKKFGRHLATIKYRLLLSPLFMAHIYKHKEVEEYNEETVSATGLKLRLDSFMLDLHQRREAFDTLSKTKSKQARTSGMRINQAQVDFISADVRAVSANIGGTTTDDLMKGGDEILPGLEQPVPAVDLSRFHIPDQDFSWIDMDDFVELDWVLPSESNPETSILPLAYSPRFTYIRQTDHNNIINGDESRTSPFGDEPTHYCVMTQDNDPRRVQMALVEQRLREIEAQIEAHTRLTGEQELRFVRDGNMDKSLREQFDLLIEQGHELESKKAFLQGGLRHLARLLEHPKASPQSEEDLYGSGSSSAATSDSGTQGHPEMDGLYTSPNDDLASDFNNKFIVHNVQLKWNNPLRNVILRYMHQMSQRRGFVYYMSRRAVKFILDIVEEQNKNKYQQRPESYAGRTQSHEGPDDIGSPTEEKDEDVVVKDRIEQLLNDAKQFVDADASEDNNQEKGTSTAEHGDQIAEDFTAQNTYHVRLVAPQIQLQSEKNTKSVALVAAKGMQLKVISIMDRARLSDEVSGLVQQRFALEMDGAQFFVTTQKRLYKYLHLYSGNKYGNVPGSAWPPWVSLEVMFDFTLNPFGFQRIIQKTSASLHYEKYNNLRLKYNEHVAAGDDGQIDPTASPESRVDHFWVDFPRVRAICDSAQYYAMYIIVMDLLLYSEPLEKIRSERLEKIMLASDFSDLRGAPEIATRLQDRIRQLEEIKNHFQINAKYLDRQGWQDRIGVERDLVGYEDELFFIMKAITTSQRKAEERKTTQSTGLLRWYLSASEIVWHLMRDKNEPLVEIQLRNAAYERIDNSDGSNHNAMVIERIHGLNLLPNALYPEIIGPFHDPNRKITDDNEDETMFKVHWYMLEAIAGIPVLENFEVNLYPLKVQLERELGSKLFEYIFPQVGANGSDNGGFSPLMIKHMQPLDEDEDSEAEQASEAFTPDPNSISQSRESYESATRPGAMELRLKPTMNLSYDKRPASSSASLKSKGLGFGDNLSSRFLSQSNRSPGGSRAQSTRPPTLRKGSADSVSVTIQPPSRSSTALSSSPADDKPKKFTLTRSSSKDSSAKDKDKPSDDISQMMSRASNYMTLAHVKINSVVLCLSFKGKGERNIEDVHDLVFRIPVLEYHNKTWSNLDLALRLRKDVTKALISHTGAIIGNKFSHHRPSKHQRARLRELASSSQLLPNGDTLKNTLTNNRPSPISLEKSRTSSPRRSFTSAGPSPLSRQDSLASSIRSTSSGTNISAVAPWDQPRRESTGFLPNALGRRFTHDSQRARAHDASLDDSEESTKRKTVLLLGKKILGSLS